MISINRYKALCQYLYVNNNSKRQQIILDSTRSWPCFEKLQRDWTRDWAVNWWANNYCQNEENWHSIVQPTKALKWGFKNCVCSGTSGIMYEFFVYSGWTGKKMHWIVCCVESDWKPTEKAEFQSTFIITDFPQHLSCATIRQDRTKGWSLPAEKDFKRKGRSFSHNKVDTNSGISISKWYDYKRVQLISNYCNRSSETTLKRWNRK